MLKGRQHFDEKYIKVNGKDCYDLNCIDHITKYVTAHLFVGKRTKKNCIKFLSQIKQTCYAQILGRYYCERRKQKRELIVFVCDKFGNYRAAFNKVFFRVATLHFGIPIKARKGGLEHNNNPIERYNGKLKDRLKVMRGGFRSVRRARHFLNFKHIINNFVNPHLGLQGKTPAAAAEIDLGLGRNKLLNLIKKRAQRKHHSLR